MNPHAQTALGAIQALHCAATLGDAEAVAALVEIGNRTAGYLAALASVPEFGAGHLAAGEVAKHSLLWPVALPGLDLDRQSELARFAALEVGSKTGIRMHENSKGGKPRNFRFASQTGFARSIWHMLEAERTSPNRRRHPADIHPELAAPGVLTEAQLKRDWKQLAALLKPLANADKSLDEWTAAGVELCRYFCGGKWDDFPWPACVLTKAGKTVDENGGVRSTESAVAGKIRDGLKSLI